MASVPQDLTYFAEALKIDYLPAIKEQLNNSSYLLSKVRRNERDVSGSKWQSTVHTKRNAGVGSGSETGLPTAGHQEWENPYGTVKYNRGRIEISGPVIAASRDDKGAMVRALDAEIQGVTTDLKAEIEFQVHNDGTGCRALINGDPGTDATITVDNPGTRYLSEGMFVEIVTAADGLLSTSGVATTRYISTITDDVNFELDAAADTLVADNDWVIRTGSRTVTGTTASYDMMGLKGIIDDGTYVTTLHGLSRTTYPFWKCATFSTDSNAGTLRDLTLPLMQSAVSAVEKNGGSVDLILCDHATRDAYAALVVADKRFPNTMKLDGGFTALEFNGIPIVADPMMASHTMFFIDTSQLQIMQMGDWNWMDKDGAVLSRVTDYDKYEAVLYWYADFTCQKPSSMSFLRDIQ
jgi:hypothetical protein